MTSSSYVRYQKPHRLVPVEARENSFARSSVRSFRSVSVRPLRRFGRSTPGQHNGVRYEVPFPQPCVFRRGRGPGAEGGDQRAAAVQKLVCTALLPDAQDHHIKPLSAFSLSKATDANWASDAGVASDRKTSGKKFARDKILEGATHSVTVTRTVTVTAAPLPAEEDRIAALVSSMSMSDLQKLCAQRCPNSASGNFDATQPGPTSQAAVTSVSAMRARDTTTDGAPSLDAPKSGVEKPAKAEQVGDQRHCIQFSCSRPANCELTLLFLSLDSLHRQQNANSPIKLSSARLRSEAVPQLIPAASRNPPPTVPTPRLPLSPM